MSLQFFSGFFKSPSEVLDDVKSNKTWPTTFVSGPSEGLPVHWHSDEVHAYIMEGETDFFDETTGKRTPVTAGDKIIVPARTLHAEGVVKDRVVYILALPQPLAADKFLAMHEPDTL
ncbi:MAG: cupin domain-containing protein [Alphaproteobacteria bacterium]|nr:MAG: cupin domain-containing protein [Alphaproteobacteria bacterium]